MKKNKIIILICCIFMLIGSFVSIYAEEHNGYGGEYDIINLNGKEIKVAVSMSLDDKEKLMELLTNYPTISLDGVFKEVTTQLNIFYETDEKTRTLSTSVLEVSMVKQDVSTSSNTKKYKISSVAVWKSNPLCHGEDYLAISWGQEFSVQSHSAVGYYKSGSTTQLFSNSTTFIKHTPNYGIAYSYQCGTTNSQYYWDPWYIQVDVVLAHAASSSGNELADVVAIYAHRKNSLTGSIEIDLKGQISITPQVNGSIETSEPRSLQLIY